MTLTNLGKSLFTDNLSKDKSLISSLLNYISPKISKLSNENIQQDIKTPSIKHHRYPWWVEVKTISPYCVYYFGPFETIKQARLNQGGYIEDLVEEKAYGITVELKQCLPDNLTFFAE